MSPLNNNSSSWQKMIPRSGAALVGIILVALVAFTLGGLLFDGGSAPVETGQADAAGASSEPTVWTCSMHPQIRLPRPGKCPICFMDLIPLDAGRGEEIDPNQLRMSETAKQLAKIETTPVRRAFAAREVRMVGKVSYDETSLAYITAWVPGRLDRLYADYTGVTVNKGGPMASIYSPELVAAQEELLQAKTAVESLGNSPSKVLKSTALATVDAAREKLGLFGLSESQVADIETSGKASDHLVLNAPIGGVVIHKDAQEGMYVQTGTRIYTIADLSKLWVMFEAYESDLPWLRYGQKVTFSSASFPGETFVATVSFLDPLVDPRTRTVNVRAIVRNDSRKLKPDMFVRGIVTARVDARGDVIDPDLAGKWISPMHPEIVKAGPGECDICGMPLVRAESLGYASRTITDADAPLLIPASAPLITGKRAVVYVEVPNEDGPLFEGRMVELGPRAGDFYVVKSGVAEGEKVVTNGAFRIDSELQIRAKPSMMSPTGGSPPAGHQHGAQAASMGSSPATSTAMVLTDQKEGDRAAQTLTPMYNAYFAVQMALANDDHSTAVGAANELAKAIAGADMASFGLEGHGTFMKLVPSLTTAAEAVARSADIAEAREGFFDLSNAIISLHDTFGHAERGDFYLTFCPMARGNTGAYWLQTENIVWNSFYGEAMLRCGEIKKPLPSLEGDGE